MLTEAAHIPAAAKAVDNVAIPPVTWQLPLLPLILLPLLLLILLTLLPLILLSLLSLILLPLVLVHFRFQSLLPLTLLPLALLSLVLLLVCDCAAPDASEYTHFVTHALTPSHSLFSLSIS